MGLLDKLADRTQTDPKAGKKKLGGIVNQGLNHLKSRWNIEPSETSKPSNSPNDNY